MNVVVVIVIAVLVLLVFFVVFGPPIGWYLVTSRKNWPIGRPPKELNATAVSFANPSGDLLSGWLSAGRPGRGVIVLMHGHMNSRLSMIARAKFLQREGFGVLLFDFRAHGKSGGPRTSFGYIEREDADAAVSYVAENFPGEKIGVLAVSMGGAAFLLSKSQERVNAAVLEMVYPRLENAVLRRIQVLTGFLAPIFRPKFFTAYQKTFSIDPRAVWPIGGVSYFMPRLIIAGAKDPFTPLHESQELFDNAQGPKELWVVKGRGHDDFYPLVRLEYERRVASFFAILSSGTATDNPSKAVRL